ncbi:hypothetical protein [Cellulomonas olei]
MIRFLLVSLAEVVAVTAAVGLMAWADRDRPASPGEFLRGVL